MNKKKIIVLLGGKSTEHEISLKTGSFIFNTLNRNKYTVKSVLVDKSGNWIIPENYENKNPLITQLHKNSAVEFKTEFTSSNTIISDKGISVDKLDCDAVFLGLHGGEGENGTIQGLLESIEIPYTGSGILASALAMDKEKANLLFAAGGFNVAPFINFTRDKYNSEISKDLPAYFKLKFPAFVKPTFGGSSVGTGKVNSIEELKLKLEELFKTEEKVIVQENISGTEVSCGVLEKKENEFYKPFALPATEIRPINEFFDFEAKYTSGKSNEITPAEISSDMMKLIQENALKAHLLLGCKGYSRTDFIIQNDTPYILETNTLPGMTEMSLIPQQAKYIGLKMEDLLDLLLENALSI